MVDDITGVGNWKDHLKSNSGAQLIYNNGHYLVYLLEKVIQFNHMIICIMHMHRQVLELVIFIW